MDMNQYFTGIVFHMDSKADKFDDFTTYKIRHYPEMVDCKCALSYSKYSIFCSHHQLHGQ